MEEPVISGIAIGTFGILLGLALVLGRHRLAEWDAKERNRVGIFANATWYTRTFEVFSAVVGTVMVAIGVFVLVVVLA